MKFGFQKQGKEKKVRVARYNLAETPSIKREGLKAEDVFALWVPGSIAKTKSGDFDVPYEEEAFGVEVKGGMSNTVNQIKVRDNNVLCYIRNENDIIVVPAIRVLMEGLSRNNGQHSPDVLSTFNTTVENLRGWGVQCNKETLKETLVQAHIIDIPYKPIMKLVEELYVNRYNSIREENKILQGLIVESHPGLKRFVR